MGTSKTSLTRRQVLAAMGAVVAAGCGGKRPPAESPGRGPMELILCGAEEVFILPMGMEADVEPRKIWSWRAAQCPDIPASLVRAFRSTDDCKPVEGGKKILVSSSSGAVALIERETGRAPFSAAVINAHSVEMLPGGRIAAAASVNESPLANRIIVFDIASKRELSSDRLVSAHGVVWDEKRDLLWALGNDQLRAYRVAEGDGRLGLEFQTKLPEDNGHDLTPMPGSPRLFISTGHRCWFFDRDTRQLVPHDVLGEMEKIKSYSVHPGTGRIAYVQAEGTNWWAQRVRFLNPEGVLQLPGQRLYKARWVG